MRRSLRSVFLFAGLLLTVSVLTACHGGGSYYVSPGGSDSASGSQANPWRTLANVDTVPANSHVYLQRGGTYTGPLEAKSNALAVDAYGSGGLPVIQNGSYAGIDVYADDVHIANVFVTDNIAGIFTRPSAARTEVRNSWLADNNRMSVNTPGGDDDSGAFGFLIQGDDGLFYDNLVTGSISLSFDYGIDGAAFEIYGGSSNVIRHNNTQDNAAFAELGKPSGDTSADNTFAYNRYWTDIGDARGLVTRGAGNFGPIERTRMNNNTFWLTGATSEGFVCASCSGDNLVLKNNIIKGIAKAGFGTVQSSYNTYVGSASQITTGSNDSTAAPQLVDPQNGDLHLQATSPARNSGTDLSYDHDLDGAAVPNGVTDRGCYEYH